MSYHLPVFNTMTDLLSLSLSPVPPLLWHILLFFIFISMQEKLLTARPRTNKDATIHQSALRACATHPPSSNSQERRRLKKEKGGQRDSQRNCGEKKSDTVDKLQKAREALHNTPPHTHIRRQNIHRIYTLMRHTDARKPE